MALLFITVQNTFAQTGQVRTTDTMMKFRANAGAGFNFEYLIFLPKGTPLNTATYLMVETNNTGLNDTIKHHLKGALHAAANGVASYVARRLHLPLLVPIFPRSATHWTYYTHALDKLYSNIQEELSTGCLPEEALMAAFLNTDKEFLKKAEVGFYEHT